MRLACIELGELLELEYITTQKEYPELMECHLDIDQYMSSEDPS